MLNSLPASLLLILTLFSTNLFAQEPKSFFTSDTTVAANTSFIERSSSFKKLWGQNRREEWAAAVKVPVLKLDEVYGGLIPQKSGGGNETKSLQLRSAGGKEYSLRSVDKSRDDVIPPGFDKTFLEDIVRDGVSQSHPYSALALAGMQQAAGILHPEPILVYLPKQPALDSFNVRFGEDLYFLEQRPDGDWTEAENLGGFNTYVSTEDVIKSLLANSYNKADQRAFLKARLFDMLIGDWDRHEGNWKWGVKDSGDQKLFYPVPRDRDQAFYTHNGILLDRFLPMAGLSFMQNFDFENKNINPLNKAARSMDRFFTNGLALNDWLDVASQLEVSLTNEVIENSIHSLPPEIYALSGQELIAKLKSRRSDLKEYARSYYKEVAVEIDVAGSNSNEYFKLTSDAGGDITLNGYGIGDDPDRPGKLFYNRIIKPAETNEIRLFGIAGKDIFVSQTGNTPITIRIIGGTGHDSLIHSGNHLHYYDDNENGLTPGSAKLHLSEDSTIHYFEYKMRTHFKNGIAPVPIYYNNEDRFYGGLNFNYRNNSWRRNGSAIQHLLGVYYSYSQNAFSTAYTASRQVMKRANLFLHGEYDNIRWTNFYGYGNESKAGPVNFKYYRMLSEEWLVSIGLKHSFRKNSFEIVPFFQQSGIRNDTSKFVYREFKTDAPDVYLPNQYVGLKVAWQYISLNDPVVPNRGIELNAAGKLVKNMLKSNYFEQLGLRARVYLPLGKKFSLSITAGGETVVNNSHLTENAQLYQHAVIGGPKSLRGYRVERFWGKTSFHNNNELRFITHLKTYFMNARIGLLVFFDDGRVWLPGENSNKLHTAYGGGLILAPFNKLFIQATYGVSPETSLVQLSVNTFL